jgi:hypothetical protein
LSWAVQKLAEAGMQTVRTFDLQGTQAAFPGYSCQMVILFVYAGEMRSLSNQPVCVMIEGQGESTSMSIVDSPQQRCDSWMEAVIRKTLLINLEEQAK